MIARRIEQASQWNLADALIVGRGGGSLEDLLPFSDEQVVRAIAASTIPVISAVGHEIDWVLSDFAADLRAPTPSAAAELISENRAEAAETLNALEQEFYKAMQGKLERARLLMKPFNPADLEFRFRGILQPSLVRFDDAKEELLGALSNRLRELRSKLDVARTSLEAASPLGILERGFSVVTQDRTGRILRRAGDAEIGEPLTILLLEGSLGAKVESIYKKLEEE